MEFEYIGDDQFDKTRSRSILEEEPEGVPSGAFPGVNFAMVAHTVQYLKVVEVKAHTDCNSSLGMFGYSNRMDLFHRYRAALVVQPCLHLSQPLPRFHM